MAIPRVGLKCPETALSVPECSCKRCLELMLREFSPDLLAGEMRVTRVQPRPDSEQREAA